jgi:hypothetical protein
MPSDRGDTAGMLPDQFTPVRYSTVLTRGADRDPLEAQLRVAVAVAQPVVAGAAAFDLGEAVARNRRDAGSVPGAAL